MSEVALYMASKHRECESKFTRSVSYAIKEDWVHTKIYWNKFVDELLIHMMTEDEILFPEFEQSTGMTNGPTFVLKLEHDQIRAKIQMINVAIKKKSKDQFMEHAVLLKAILQQHNLKEEQIIYPLSARTLPNTGNLIQQIQKIYEEEKENPGTAKHYYK